MLPAFFTRDNRLERCLLALVAAATVTLGACQPTPEPPERGYERAEALLRAGDYDGAARLYDEFLETHPYSPLAPMARQRLLNIDRELEAIMGRRAAPAPIYIRPPESTAGGNANPTREAAWGRSEP